MSSPPCQIDACAGSRRHSRRAHAEPRSVQAVLRSVPISSIRALTVVGATVVFVVIAVVVFALHLGFRPVLSSSMRPTYGPGALVVTRPVPTSALRPGMIIEFTPPGEHVAFAHRIVSVTGPVADRVITTKGDANRAPDPWHLRLTSSTVPAVLASVPWVGRLMVGLRGPVRLVLIIFGGVYAAVAGARLIVRPTRRWAEA